jgi:hypothetical protein
MSKLSNNSFEDQWREAFDDASLIPSESVWERIESSLDAPTSPSAEPSTGGGIAMNGTMLYSIVAIVGLGLLGLWFWKNSLTNDPQVTPLPSSPIIEQALPLASEPIIPPTEVVKEEQHVVPKHEPKVDENTIQPLAPVEEVVVEKNVVDSLNILTPMNPNYIPIQTRTTVLHYTDVPSTNTPYFEEKPMIKPKPQKKNILKNVRISVGGGVYQP